MLSQVGEPAWAVAGCCVLGLGYRPSIAPVPPSSYWRYLTEHGNLIVMTIAFVILYENASNKKPVKNLFFVLYLLKTMDRGGIGCGDKYPFVNLAACF